MYSKRFARIDCQNMADRMPEYICPIECRNICQIERLVECQIQSIPDGMSEFMPHTVSALEENIFFVPKECCILAISEPYRGRIGAVSGPYRGRIGMILGNPGLSGPFFQFFSSSEPHRLTYYQACILTFHLAFYLALLCGILFD